MLLEEARSRLNHLTLPLSFNLFGLLVIAVVIAVCICLAASANGAQLWSVLTADTSHTGLLTAQPQSNIGKVGVERIKVTDYGIEPNEIQRVEGRFILLLQHLNNMPGIMLYLESEKGNRVRQVRLKQYGKERRRAELLDLTPGSYVLTEASHPDWVCRITITSK